MGLIRLLLLIGLGWLLFKVVRFYLSRPPAATTPVDPAANPDASRLVACAHCGTRIPLNRAVLADSRIYCGLECRRLGPAD
ncbi:MAG: hypothetical protein HQL82_06045 [Magnetococcales bacterium]|nr:hypothetical protein [Magnetococcales bacterium]